jgi:HPt (histidine-containing phosphotransfer) domain-containing protein
MTAHAMKGDREQCLAAGMDDYVSKPVRSDQLFGTLERLLARKLAIGAAPPSLPAGGDGAAVDFTIALKATNGDRRLLREIALAFLEESPLLLSELDRAIGEGNARVVQRAAHTLRSALNTFGASAAAKIAETLESLGRESDIADARRHFDSLQHAVVPVRSELQSFTGEHASPVSA